MRLKICKVRLCTIFAADKLHSAIRKQAFFALAWRKVTMEVYDKGEISNVKDEFIEFLIKNL